MTAEIKHRFRVWLPITVLPAGGDGGPTSWRRFRSNRDIASKMGLVLGGVRLNESGEISLVNRAFQWRGSRAMPQGYWQSLQQRTGDRKDIGLPDPQAESARLYPVDFAGWDGS